MTGELLPQALGVSPLPPVRLTPEQEDLCRRMDELYAPYNLHVRPSDMFRGAVFASRAECSSNPDWIAQATHSLREILDPILKPESDHGIGRLHIPESKREVFQRYGSVSVDIVIDQVGRAYNRLSHAAHHNENLLASSDFGLLMADFESTMSRALIRQLDLHSEIDAFLSSDPPQERE